MNQASGTVAPRERRRRRHRTSRRQRRRALRIALLTGATASLLLGVALWLVNRSGYKPSLALPPGVDERSPAEVRALRK